MGQEQSSGPGCVIACDRVRAQSEAWGQKDQTPLGTVAEWQQEARKHNKVALGNVLGPVGLRRKKAWLSKGRGCWSGGETQKGPHGLLLTADSRLGAPLWRELGQLPNQLPLRFSQCWPREDLTGARARAGGPPPPYSLFHHISWVCSTKAWFPHRPQGIYGLTQLQPPHQAQKLSTSTLAHRGPPPYYTLPGSSLTT